MENNSILMEENACKDIINNVSILQYQMFKSMLIAEKELGCDKELFNSIFEKYKNDNIDELEKIGKTIAEYYRERYIKPFNKQMENVLKELSNIESEAK